jgi:plasmid stabilization system protein ParE
VKEIVILSGAEADLIELYARFEEFGSGMGDWFVGDCRRTFERLSQHPELAAVYRGPFRRRFLKRWNVGLFYTVEMNRVLIHAALDIRQSPDNILRRLGL